LFVRKRSWHNLIRHLDSLHTSKQAEEFKNGILLNYIERLYLPLRDIKQKLGNKLVKLEDSNNVSIMKKTGEILERPLGENEEDLKQQRRFSAMQYYRETTRKYKQS